MSNSLKGHSTLDADLGSALIGVPFRLTNQQGLVISQENQLPVVRVKAADSWMKLEYDFSQEKDFLALVKHRERLAESENMLVFASTEEACAPVAPFPVYSTELLHPTPAPSTVIGSGNGTVDVGRSAHLVRDILSEFDVQIDNPFELVVMQTINDREALRDVLEGCQEPQSGAFIASPNKPSDSVLTVTQAQTAYPLPSMTGVCTDQRPIQADLTGAIWVTGSCTDSRMSRSGIGSPGIGVGVKNPSPVHDSPAAFLNTTGHGSEWRSPSSIRSLETAPPLLSQTSSSAPALWSEVTSPNCLRGDGSQRDSELLKRYPMFEIEPGRVPTSVRREEGKTVLLEPEGIPPVADHLTDRISTTKGRDATYIRTAVPERDREGVERRITAIGGRSSAGNECFGLDFTVTSGMGETYGGGSPTSQVEQRVENKKSLGAYSLAAERLLDFPVRTQNSGVEALHHRGLDCTDNGWKVADPGRGKTASYHSPQEGQRTVVEDLGSLQQHLIANYPPAEQDFVRLLIHMGFPVVLAFHCVRQLGTDQTKVFDYLEKFQLLCDDGYSPDMVMTVLDLVGTDPTEAAACMKAVQFFRELGYSEIKIQEALIASKGNRDVALSFLTAST